MDPARSTPMCELSRVLFHMDTFNFNAKHLWTIGGHDTHIEITVTAQWLVVL